jgi:hypothetical protein
MKPELGQISHLIWGWSRGVKIRAGAGRGGPGPLPRNPNGKVLKAPLRKTDFGGPVSG